MVRSVAKRRVSNQEATTVGAALALRDALAALGLLRVRSGREQRQTHEKASICRINRALAALIEPPISTTFAAPAELAREC
jgi:hypothetical protein